MGAKVYKRKDGSWWVRTHHRGKKSEKRFGLAKKDKAQAEKVAEKINAMIALGTYAPDRITTNPKPIPLDQFLWDWHALYHETFKPRYRETSEGLIRNHLEPFFGAIDVRDLRESHLLEFANAKANPSRNTGQSWTVKRTEPLHAPTKQKPKTTRQKRIPEPRAPKAQAPSTIKNALSLLRSAMNHAVREEVIPRNPALGVGKLVARIARSSGLETKQVEAWSREEVEALLALAGQHEKRFEPMLRFLFSTGARRSEALAIKWEDVDFSRGRIHIRRSATKGEVGTPKNGKARTIVMSPSLAESLFDLLGDRRRSQLDRGWPEVPEWVFCSEVGRMLDERNVQRSWHRLRRLAQKHGVRPLGLHSARHTFASLALDSGKSIRFVADQLGHGSPAFTLETYAHMLPVEAGDMGFADFGATLPGSNGVAKRHYASPASDEPETVGDRNDEDDWIRRGMLERETGFEPATLSLGS